MLKRYIVNGLEFQYEEGTQPVGAVEVKAEQPKTKAVTPKNKARKGTTK